MSLWGLCTDKTINLSHAGKKKVGPFAEIHGKKKFKTLLLFEDWIISEKVSEVVIFTISVRLLESRFSQDKRAEVCVGLI